MRERAISAAVLVPVLLIVLAIGGPAIALAIVLITAVAAVEVFRLLRAAGHDAFPALGIVLAVTIVLDAAFPDVLDGSGLLLSAIGVVLVGVAAMTHQDPRHGLVAWMATVFGAFYVSLLAFVIRLGNTAPPIAAGAPFEPLGAERGWILLLILAVWSFDTGAFLVGRQFGQTRFITHISPAKTVEGVAGGVVASTVVVAVLLWGLGQAPAHALLLGPLTALAAQAGDLAESMLKRAAGAKDSGTLIPGHGGMLDRIDSFLFAAPVVSLYVVAFLR
jgi:phosphatidate cytidylyltransferase